MTAVADQTGDYESYKQITGIDNKGVTLSYASEHPSSGQTQNKTETHISRTVLTQDLQSAHDYHELFGDTDPPSFPGTTAISASSAVLAELNNTGTSPFSFQPDGLKGTASSLLSALGGIAGVDPKQAGGGALGGLMKGEQCTLKRAGSTVFAFPVLLNSQPTTMPALHATCATDDGIADFYRSGPGRQSPDAFLEARQRFTSPGSENHLSGDTSSADGRGSRKEEEGADLWHLL